MTRARVLVADDHQILTDGLKNLLAPEFDLVGVVEDGQALLEAAKRLRPDVIVADITMPRMNGIDALIELKKEDPAVKVVFLTMHRKVAYARRALKVGASGFVLKQSALKELVRAIRGALEGRPFVTPALAEELQQPWHADRSGAASNALTRRQLEVLELLAVGKTAKEIADVLRVSTRTVEFHKYEMMRSLGIESSAGLIHFAIKQGIVTI